MRRAGVVSIAVGAASLLAIAVGAGFLVHSSNRSDPIVRVPRISMSRLSNNGGVRLTRYLGAPLSRRPSVFSEVDLAALGIDRPLRERAQRLVPADTNVT